MTCPNRYRSDAPGIQHQGDCRDAEQFRPCVSDLVNHEKCQWRATDGTLAWADNPSYDPPPKQAEEGGLKRLSKSVKKTDGPASIVEINEAKSRALKQQALAKHEGDPSDLPYAEWKELAREIAIQVARVMMFFTPDDVWAAGLSRPPLKANGDERSATCLGGIMTKLAREGMIEKTDRAQNTKQVKSRQHGVTVWRSLIFGKRDPEPVPAGANPGLRNFD
jgi:hypothetical protein